MKFAILGALAVLLLFSLFECISLWLYKEPVDDGNVRDINFRVRKNYDGDTEKF